MNSNNEHNLEEFKKEIDLVKKVKNHVDDYKNCKKDKILNSFNYKTFKYKNSTINTSHFSELITSNSIDAEVHNSKIIYGSLRTKKGPLGRYIASSNSLWTYLAHTHLFEFMVKLKKDRNRKVPIEDITKFFFSYDSTKKKIDNSHESLLRNNYLSYLWWTYTIALKCKKLEINKVLKFLFTDKDFTQNLFERPNIFLIDSVFGGVISFAIDDIPLEWANKGYELFDKIKGTKIARADFFREFFKRLNVKGGFINFEVLNEDEMVLECRKITEKMMSNYKIDQTKTD